MVTDLLKDSSFIIEQPSYPPIKHVLDKHRISYTQARVEKMELISMKSFKNNDILYITPSHQFPTGYVMSLKKRTQLIKWAQQKKERYIIEDDYDSEFRYFGKPIPALQNLDKTKVIYISTFSKSLYPSCRMAYIVLPNKLLKLFREMKYVESNTVPVHLQHMVAQFMATGGSFERHLNKMRRIYKNKLTLF